MTPAALEAINAVRRKRLQQAVQALEEALAEGRAVRDELLRVSGLLERGIDPAQVRSTFGDVPRLLEAARVAGAQQSAEQPRDPRRASRRTPV